jgi:hypothetical protein
VAQLPSAVLKASSELDGVWTEGRGAVGTGHDHAEALAGLRVERFGVVADVIHGARVGGPRVFRRAAIGQDSG